MSSKESPDLKTIAKHQTITCGQILWICLIGVSLMTGGGVTPPTGAGVSPMTGAGVSPMTDRTLIGTHQMNPRFELHGMHAATRLSMSCFLSGAADGGMMWSTDVACLPQ